MLNRLLVSAAMALVPWPFRLKLTSHWLFWLFSTALMLVSHVPETAAVPSAYLTPAPAPVPQETICEPRVLKPPELP